ncbi:variant erythrocyte surface antigen-1 family protein [Babesia caballi]|uniref:Variant erythrocyte surface antigen-1 family protein n=1 Tax=Babesia caballi TaxID=5871 RepID=A0AAV4LSE4_BABCB|nr:variant erythrocyte surface antigen-1 family protein [Babesia caballi]
MTFGKKSLTDAPKDLKEAIDWVLRVSGDGFGGSHGAIAELAKALTASIKKTPHGKNDNVKKILAVFTKDEQKIKPNGPIKQLGDALTKFIGYESSGDWSGNTYNHKINGRGIIKQVDIYSKSKRQNNNGVYTSAYYGSAWGLDVEIGAQEQKQRNTEKAVQCFFTAIAFIYEGLTELYLKCKTEWKTENLGGNSGGRNLKEFMQQNGFEKAKLNSDMTGQRITTQALQSLTEFSTAHSAAGSNPSLDAFRSQLEQNAWSNPSNYPLSALYILAAPAYTQTSIPSFLSYSGPASTILSDCPSNLKEAIDWILRVTGRDGGSNKNDGANKLAEAIVKLPDFNTAINAALKKQEGVSGGVDISQALAKITNSGTLEEIIKKLAEGLRAFIGYDNDTIKHSTIGIGLYNDPLERLQDAVLKFTEIFFQGFKHQNYKTHLNLNRHERNLDSAIKKLQSGFGGDPKKFNEAVQGLEGQLNGVNGSDVDTILGKLKDIKSLKDKSQMSDLASAVETFMSNVLDQVTQDSNVTRDAGQPKNHVETLRGQLDALLDELKKNTGPIDESANSQVMGKMKSIYQTFEPLGQALKSITHERHPVARVLVAASYNGVVNFISQLKTGYMSYYQAATWSDDTVSLEKCGKILMACLPFIFDKLGYLFWHCSQGLWNGLKLDGSAKPSNGIKQTDLKHFMDVMSFSAHWLNGGKTGGNVLNVMNTSFKDLAAASTSASTYDVFLKNLKDKAADHLNDPNANPLGALFCCSKAYFQGCHLTNAETRPPSTIREMLYWLSGLQFAPGYNDLEKHIVHVVKPEFKVAISGSPTTSETLTADQVTEYLVTACLYSPTVFCNIQEPGISNNADEPWLHSLFSNSEFNFTYPSSGSSLLYKVADYADALQFQLGFLYKQCTHIHTNTCGWYMCQFGKRVNVNVQDGAILSHICPAGCSTSEHGTGDNAEGDCQHAGCGTSKHSPLQAFLTDKLPGFSLPTATNQLTYSDGHMADHTPGSMCHVQMGFDSTKLRGSGMGAHIKFSLQSFCGSSASPLPQLCHTLSCITKRTPRTLGDLFGFTWHLTGQMFNKTKNDDKDPSPRLSGVLDTLLLKLKNFKTNLLYEGLADNAKDVGSALFGLSWHCHWKNSWRTDQRKNSSQYCDDHTSSKTACDLMSLYDSECEAKTCGKYLEPLGISSGATFADKYAFIYLSWAAHLTDELYESLQEFLEEFNDHTCKGCKLSPSCSSHISASQCRCPSVVDCADVLPHLYANGFNFKDAFSLKGMQYEGSRSKYTQTAQTKRQCSAFVDQLQSVINGNPLSKLLTSIDDFLYAIRWEFFSKLSGFWTIYICLILYTFFFLLDTLHLRSHLKLTASHTIPPIALLTSGNPLPVTKLTYITQ